MSRHLSTETFQMDLRSSPSQQNLDPSRSSSLRSQQEDMDPQNSNEKPHKLDLYSIPVFLLEVIILLGLAYLAHFLHFQYQHEPLISGFYCDDIAYRQHFVESNFSKAFSDEKNELPSVALALVVPIVLIIFVELVNSMFGALKFRQIRALCTCCKLHSITRRSIRFSGAFALGFFIVMISCDVLGSTSGRLRPFFEQDCPAAYQPCLIGLNRPLADGQGRDLSGLTTPPLVSTSTVDTGAAQPSPVAQPPSSAPISSISSPVSSKLVMQNSAVDSRSAAIASASLLNRQWIDLSTHNLRDVCNYPRELTPEAEYRFKQLAMSWPSFPAAIFTYTCLFISCYLCFVGTARPFRMISSVLVVLLLLLTTIFNVQLVKEHFQHWDDVAAGSFLAAVVVIFVLLVYLNRFKDTHYYENQKLFKSRLFNVNNSFRSYSGDATGHYNLDKGDGPITNGALSNGETNGAITNNDLAMRYFQIPRANYRGAPRPLSTVNQMRS